ncbi:hypothetical protein LCGC14_0685350 [marine sediment metagenome]|uniref:Uncharacterized protein n=1 Tax=marine sediment metagenome TaxID=412755 RepID=A0A0F9TUZ5_9ZZZZ
MLKNFPKKDYLTIPIEMYSCEVIIKKNQKLAEMEKIILKYIYNENSVKQLLNDFNFDHFIINKILAKLLYRGLLRLKLDIAQFQLSNKILPFIKNDKLDDYLDKGAVSESRSVSILQEKISGEIFIENAVKEYLKNPSSLTTNYLDLRIVSLDLFPDLKDFSLDKFIKCIRSQIKVEIKDIEKVNLLYPRHYTKLYIPLKEKDNQKYLDFDLEIFPRRVQKAWQNAYEIDHGTPKENLIEIYTEETEFLSNNLFKIHFNKDLILFEDTLRKIDRSLKSKKEIQDLLMINNDLEKKLILLIEKVKSINKISFYHKDHELLKNLVKYISYAKEYIIICSTHLSSDAIEFLTLMLEDFNKRDVKIIILWNNLVDIDDQNKIYQDIKNKFSENLRKNVHLMQSRIHFNSNFILIDNNFIFYTNYSLLAQDVYLKDQSFPFFILEGGTSSNYFLEFCCDLLPQKFELKKAIQEKIIENYEEHNVDLSEERMNYIKNIRNVIAKLKGKILSYSFEELPPTIDQIKKLLLQLDLYNNISIIRDIEHSNILIDAMRETNKNFILYTDKIHREQLGPHFMKYLGRIPKFQIFLNDIEVQDETQRNLGISGIKKIMNTEINLKLEIKNFPKFNCLYVEDNFIIFTNNRFLDKFRRRQLFKEIGIIFYFTDIEEYNIFF